MKLFALIHFGLIVAVNSQIKDWNYDDTAAWAKKYSTCGALGFQSPVHLNASASLFVSGPEISRIERKNFDQMPTSLTVSNNGRFVTWTPKYAVGKEPQICKGPFIGFCYILDNFIIHWGMNDITGSEHSPEGRKYAAEIQFIFRLKGSVDLASAIKFYNGVAAIGVFLEVDPSFNIPNVLLNTNILGKITNPGTSYTYLTSELLFNLNMLMPCNFDAFFTYSGALTYPPCHSTCTWIVMNQTVKISSNSLNPLRLLRTTEQFRNIKSWREVQNLGQRFVVRTFL